MKTGNGRRHLTKEEVALLAFLTKEGRSISKTEALTAFNIPRLDKTLHSLEKRGELLGWFIKSYWAFGERRFFLSHNSELEDEDKPMVRLSDQLEFYLSGKGVTLNYKEAEDIFGTKNLQSHLHRMATREVNKRRIAIVETHKPYDFFIVKDDCMELRSYNVEHIYKECVRCRVKDELSVFKSKLNEYDEDIRSMLYQLRRENSLPAALYNVRRDGEVWTPYMQIVEMLLRLGHERGYVAYVGTLNSETIVKINIRDYATEKKN